MIKNTYFVLKRIWAADRRGVIWVGVYILWGMIPSAFNALIFKLVIDSIEKRLPALILLLIIALYAAVRFADGFVGNSIYGSRIAGKMAMRVEAVLTHELLTKAQMIDASEYDDPVFYDRLRKAAAEVETRAMTVLTQVLSLFRSIANLIIGVGLLAALSPLFILLALTAGVGMYFLNLKYMKQHFQFNEEITPVSRRVDYFKGLFYQKSTMSDIKQYTSFGALLFDKFKDVLNKKHQMTQEINRKRLVVSVKATAVVALTGTFVPYIYMAYTALRGLITIADTTVLINAYTLVTENLTSMASCLLELKESSLYIDNLREVLDYEPRIEGQDQGIELTEVHLIEFSDVSFRYPGSSKNALSNLNLRVEQGQKIAIVGINGSGKTTLVKLLMRFYDPDSGVIWINGKDIKSYRVPSLRNAITSIFQEFQSYSLPVSEIIACASGASVDSEMVCTALRKVGMFDVLSEYHDGLNTEYGKLFDENGIVLSGGQLQKLMIARMLYKNSSVLIMDEPSAALDPESEYEINRNISSASEGKTVFMISHRLSTTRDADCIILLDGGKIIETGTHERLIAQRGRYAHLFELQASGYNADGSGSEGRCELEA